MSFELILYCAIANIPVSGGKHRCPMTNEADALVHTKQRDGLNLKQGAEAQQKHTYSTYRVHSYATVYFRVSAVSGGD